MQVRDMIEQLQQFDGRSDVVFEVKTEVYGECQHCETMTTGLMQATIRDCAVKRGPDTARIILEK